MLHTFEDVRTTGRRLNLVVSAFAASLVIAMAIQLSPVSAAVVPTLRTVNVPGFPGVVANQGYRTLYVLSTESGAKLHCKTTCLTAWPPLLVKISVKSMAIDPTVLGKVGFVARSATMKQVTLNGFPVYTYRGDSGVKQRNGEGVVAFGGIWWLVKSTAKTASATSFKPFLLSKNIPYYPGILANATGFSLYLLSTEVGASVQCVDACLSAWIPVTVATSTEPITFMGNVKGVIGRIARSTTSYQVTYNSYPVYTYVGDAHTSTVNGEGVASYGGIWYLLNASATTAPSTSVLPYTGY